MPLLPALQPMFAALNAPAEPRQFGSIDEARAATHAAMERSIVAAYAQNPRLAREEDHTVPVNGGEIAVRIYAPRSSRPLPCHVYFHGGGFWLGTIDHFDPLCRGFAAEADCIVASAGYRLAPEHKFPTPAEDCYAALIWLVENAPNLGIDISRVSVGGMSAGGNLAAVVSMMARDRSGPQLVLQVLEVPIMDLTDLEPLRIPDEQMVISAGKEVYVQHYLSDPASAGKAYVSPALAPDLTGLPPALILSAEYDPLIADALAYAARLEKAGVRVQLHVCPGQFHGAQQMAALIPVEAAEYQSRIANALREVFGTLNQSSTVRP